MKALADIVISGLEKIGLWVGKGIEWLFTKIANIIGLKNE